MSLASTPRALVVSLLGLLVGIAACAPGAAQSPAAQVEAFAADTDVSGVILWEVGDSVSVRTFGYEDIEAGMPTSPDTRYQLGSISKWIATLVTFRLADAGVLELDVPISTYLPDYPQEGGERVTLHHLVAHTSGVPNGVMAALEAEGPA